MIDRIDDFDVGGGGLEGVTHVIDRIDSFDLRVEGVSDM